MPQKNSKRYRQCIEAVPEQAVALPAAVLGLWVWSTLTDPLVIAFVELPWGLL